MNELGFDLSSYETISPDWPLAYSRGVRFVTIRASSGLSADTMFAQHSAGAIAAGVGVMAYHWYNFAQHDPVGQAKAFLASDKSGNMLPMLDLESYGTNVPNSALISELRQWLDYVEQATGCKASIYTNPSFIKSYLTGQSWLKDYPLIIAHPESAAPLIYPPYIPGHELAWQYTFKEPPAWYGVKDTNEVAMYVARNPLPWVDWTATIPQPPASQPYQTTANLNVRTGPGSSYAIVGTLPLGTVVNVFEQASGWARHDGGATGKAGWSSLTYLKKL